MPWGFCSRPHTHGFALRLSCRAATRAALSISSPFAKVWPPNASRLNGRHHASSCRFSQHAPTGMKTCSTRG